mgnify:CR=1 FL=1
MNLSGEVIGICTAKLGGQHVSGISFAIPIDSAWQVIRQLRRYRNVRRPYIGMKFFSNQPAPRTDRLGRRFPLGLLCCVLLVFVSLGEVDPEAAVVEVQLAHAAGVHLRDKLHGNGPVEGAAAKGAADAAVAPVRRQAVRGAEVVARDRGLSRQSAR